MFVYNSDSLAVYVISGMQNLFQLFYVGEVLNEFSSTKDNLRPGMMKTDSARIEGSAKLNLI